MDMVYQGPIIATVWRRDGKGRADEARGSREQRRRRERIRTEVSLIRSRREARQVSNMVRRSLAPIDNHDKGEKQAAESIHPPDLGVVADDGEEDGAGVENHVSHCVVRPAHIV